MKLNIKVQMIIMVLAVFAAIGMVVLGLITTPLSATPTSTWLIHIIIPLINLSLILFIVLLITTLILVLYTIRALQSETITELETYVRKISRLVTPTYYLVQTVWFSYVLIGALSAIDHLCQQKYNSVILDILVSMLAVYMIIDTKNKYDRYKNGGEKKNTLALIGNKSRLLIEKLKENMPQPSKQPLPN